MRGPADDARFGGSADAPRFGLRSRDESARDAGDASTERWPLGRAAGGLGDSPRPRRGVRARTEDLAMSSHARVGARLVARHAGRSADADRSGDGDRRGPAPASRFRT